MGVIPLAGSEPLCSWTQALASLCQSSERAGAWMGTPPTTTPGFWAGCPLAPQLQPSPLYLRLPPLHRTQASGVPWCPRELVSMWGGERRLWPS